MTFASGLAARKTARAFELTFVCSASMTLFACASSADVDDESTFAGRASNVEAQSGRRGGGGASSDNTPDAGVAPRPVVIEPDSYVRGTYARPLPADRAPLPLKAADCRFHEPNTDWRIQMFPLTEGAIARAGSVSTWLPSTSPSLPSWGGMGHVYLPRVNGPANTYLRDRDTLGRFEFFGLAPQWQPTPKESHTFFEPTANGVAGTHDDTYADRALTDCEFNEPNLSLVDMVRRNWEPNRANNFSAYLSSIACHIESGPNAGKNLFMAPFVATHIAKLGGAFIGTYAGEPHIAANMYPYAADQRAFEATFFRPSEKVISTAVTQGNGLYDATQTYPSGKVDFFGYAPGAADAHVSFTRNASWTFEGSTNDGTVLSNCTYSITPQSFLAPFVDWALYGPESQATLVTQ